MAKLFDVIGQSSNDLLRPLLKPTLLLFLSSSLAVIAASPIIFSLKFKKISYPQTIANKHWKPQFASTTGKPPNVIRNALLKTACVSVHVKSEYVSLNDARTLLNTAWLGASHIVHLWYVRRRKRFVLRLYMLGVYFLLALSICDKILRKWT